MDEKVLPLYESTVDKEQEEDDYEEYELEEFKKFSNFENYFKRFNKVKLDTIALNKERDHLKNTNSYLKQQLLKYMDGLTVTKFVMDNKENTLLNTNGMKLFRDTGKSHTGYVEGQLEFQKVYHRI